MDALSSLVTAFPKGNLRRRLFPTFCQLPQFGRQCLERRLDLGEKGLAENFPMLGFGRTAMSRGLRKVEYATVRGAAAFTFGMRSRRALTGGFHFRSVAWRSFKGSRRRGQVGRGDLSVKGKQPNPMSGVPAAKPAGTLAMNWLCVVAST